ncbi:MAG: NADH-quinone oxidoreductase subunit NuoN [Alphaproteobacteria bacterium]|nr:NADH-quinone oxidoreductase subunit NuoN [Alphaproteobacteria bacterium]
MNDFDIVPLVPEIFMAMMGMGFLLVGVLQGNRATSVLIWASCVMLFITAVLTMNFDWDRPPTMNAMFILDEFAGSMKLIILLGLIASLALSNEYLQQERIARFEYPVIMIFAGIGMMLMVSATNMLSLYMALELQSLSLYVLAAFYRNSLKSAEAASKYFILGALSSGMLLFGISLIYGYSGSIDFATIKTSISGLEQIPPGFIVGMVFLLAGLAFKISAVPFHMWTPDVYQGAPSSVTAFFAIVPKVAAMGLLMRLCLDVFEPATEQWQQILYFLAVASLIVGSFAAIAQDNLKRLMAYSSIGNMGYILIGLVVASPEGAGAVLYFLLIYVFMTAGVFAIILTMRRDGLATVSIGDLAGLSQNNPILAYAMAILMFSLSGIPPLAGFFGKLFIFRAAIEQEFYILAVIGLLASVVAAYYYLRIVKVMFFDEPADKFDNIMGFERRAVLLISTAFVIGYIFAPSLVFDFAMSAVSSLFL